LHFSNDPRSTSSCICLHKMRILGFIKTFVAFAVMVAAVAALQPIQKIQVCQNKDCCQRWTLKTPLPDVLHDLFGSQKFVIETTSCFSQCDKGPNLCVSIGSGSKTFEIYLNDVKDVISLVTLLDEAVSIDVPSKLLAAVNVFEKALSGTMAFRADFCLF
jgi:(2Fe-2S) ferredoxin